MVIAVRTERGSEGLEIVKEAGTEADRARLAHEAEVLRRAAHPGVVDIVSESPGELRLRHRGTPLARLLPLPVDQGVAVVRAVAGTVADLHRQGIAHTRITPEHVLVGEDGRPRLGGFAEATDATDTTTAADVAALGGLLDAVLAADGDLAWSPALRGARHARRRARARKALAAVAASAQRPEPERRPAAHHLAGALLDALPEMTLPAPAVADPEVPRRFSDIPADFDPTDDLGWSDDDLSFLAVAEESDEEWITGQHAVLELGDARPGEDPYAALRDDADDAEWARPAAAAEPEPEAAAPSGEERDQAAEEEAPVAEPLPAVPQPVEVAAAEAARPRREPPVITIRDAPARPPGRRHGNRRLLAAAAAALLVVGLVVGVVVARELRPFGGEPTASRGPTSTTTATTVVMDPEPDVATDVTQPAAGQPVYPSACSVPAVPGPDVDGDSCPEPIELEERTATVGTVRIELGEPGDVVAVADSDCDGVATPVVLRPATGEVFVFPRWSLREAIEVEASDVVPGGERLEVVDGPCPSVVVAGDGVRQVVTGEG